MRVERLTTQAELDDIQPAWNQLAAARPFMSHQWLGAWWRHYVAANDGAPSVGQSFVLAVIDDQDHTLIAVAPWYLTHSWPGGRTVRFLGDGLACTEYPTILCRDGDERRVVAALTEWLNQQPDECWNAIHLSSCAPDDPMVSRLAEQLRSDGHQVRTASGEACWRLDLPTSWEEYLSRLSKRNRKRAKKMLRNTLDSGRATFRTADAGSFSATLEAMIQLHRRRWAGRREVSCFDSPRFRRFFRDAANHLTAAGLVRLNFLERNGQMIAADFNLVGDGTLYAYQSGIDPDALKHEPGRVLTYETIRQAVGHGYLAYDLLRGDEPYKSTVRAVSTATFDVRAIRANRSAKIRDWVWSTRHHVRTWVKKGFLAARRWQNTALIEVARSWATMTKRHRTKWGN